VLRRAIDEGKQVCSAQYMSTISKEEFKQLFWSDSEVFKNVKIVLVFAWVRSNCNYCNKV